VTSERAREDFGTFDSQVDPIAFDRRNRGLGDSRELRKIVLAELLKLTDDPDGLPDGYVNSLAGSTVSLSIWCASHVL